MLEKIKIALQISGNVLDAELEDLANAAIIDMGLAGVDDDITIESADALVQRTIIAYVAYHFELSHGSLERAKSLKVAYDENKAMLGMATGYTTWG